MAKLLGISKAASEAADAAENPQLKIPSVGVVPKEVKGEIEYRWSERAVIKQAYSMDDPNNENNTIFFVMLQVQPGSVNRGKPVFARHYINYNTFLTDDDPNSFMNTRTISALKSIVRATMQYMTADGEVPLETLQAMFPDKESTTKSNVLGKRVYATIVDRAGKQKDGDTGPAKRFQNVESYAPDA